MDEGSAKLSEELSALAHVISHDLRSPLGSIQTFAEILEARHGESLPAEGREILHLMLAESNTVLERLDALVNYSRAGSTPLRCEPLDMNEIVGQVVNDHRQEEPERDINWQIHTLAPGHGDRIQVQRIFEILIGNALKFSRGHPSATITVGEEMQNDRAKYYVSDNGAGFDPRYTDRLFRPFSRLHPVRQFEGVGVDLAIARIITTRHGGTISVAQAEPGAGATFQFDLGAA